MVAARSSSLVVGGPAADTLHVRSTRLFATIPLAMIAVGGCTRRALPALDPASAEGCATGDAGREPLANSPKVFLPTRQGFDEYFGLPYSNDMTPLPLMENEDVIEESPDLSQLTKRYTQRALDFITRNQQNRFFLYLAHTMPHIPIAASDDFK